MRVEQDPPPSDSLPPGEGEFTRVVQPFKVAVGSLGEGASQARLKPRTTGSALSNHSSHHSNQVSLRLKRRNLVAPPFLRDCFASLAKTTTCHSEPFPFVIARHVVPRQSRWSFRGLFCFPSLPGRDCFADCFVTLFLAASARNDRIGLPGLLRRLRSS